MKNIKVKALILALAAAMCIPAFSGMARAEEYKTDNEWKVTFTTSKKMVSNFKTGQMDDIISKLQPGDLARFEINLKSEYDADADWYMSNKVIHSLEDSSKVANGGLYSYKLVYMDSKKQNHVLFDSDQIGGEDPDPDNLVGLHQATQQLEEYFFLDNMKKGQTGLITLEVGLDGETQGNDYQDTKADLDMKFAVELPEKEDETTKKKTTTRRVIKKVTKTIKEMRNAVKTGEDRNMLPFIIMGAVCGLILLFIGLYSRSLRKRENAEMGREE